MVAEKSCSVCKQVKPLDEYHKQKIGRFGRTSACRVCTSRRAAHGYQVHRIKRLARNKAYRDGNKERLKGMYRGYRQVHRERERERLRRWVKQNPDKVAAYNLRVEQRTGKATIVRLQEWIKKNPHRVRANIARRRASKVQATPGWADSRKIAAIYKLAGEKGMVVDHIVPLRSRLVCGLHVEHNLQLLTSRENAIKGNRFWPDMPEPLKGE